MSQNEALFSTIKSAFLFSVYRNQKNLEILFLRESKIKENYQIRNQKETCRKKEFSSKVKVFFFSHYKVIIQVFNL